MFVLQFEEGEAKRVLQNNFPSQKQETEEVIEFAAGTVESMVNMQVMRRMGSHVHISLALRRIGM